MATRNVAGYPSHYIAWLLYIVAIILFVLWAFSDVGTRQELLGLGLAFFAAGHVVP